MLKRTRLKNVTKFTFVLPADEPAGPVSVVGDFNGWTPGKHTLVRRSNGTRSVSITLRQGQTVRFRYLGADGYWFDEEHADGHDGQNCLIRT
ncbi:hypothetical protein C3Y87_01915 [Carbonactinospora thermoautotrophica]|uniref:Glycoside hydrolase family 13 domain protein n=1 Tax=Carbonactinospora thermoautotrophica TaxID=1469144 RepID=A0A132N067_9ACTN|nr:isoamylase early set domain-containing protein [Carbonactinospora thermoautotrophica]KWX02305.1 Glycoside hydrolase family 13 domain protein [Carbonactinospora thermoautotrophica]KWX03474.1 hypothetical protein TH66_11275 [Carbonactinospora thermoautotrophica]KWX09052.1 hypothetical protein TR74_11925 [Carbonactinospora thermoautotrophica]MCX9190187.1 hypothetical protein [Carbonactinospora thermoautotrophica]